MSYLGNIELPYLKDAIMSLPQKREQDEPRGHYHIAADICVVPFRDTKVTCCKSPLKIVKYMAMGKAIVASNVGEVRRMLGGVAV